MVPAVSRYQGVTFASRLGEDFGDPLKKAAAAEGRRRLFEVHDDVLSRRVRTKSKKHYVPAGTASP